MDSIFDDEHFFGLYHKVSETILKSNRAILTILTETFIFYIINYYFSILTINSH